MIISRKHFDLNDKTIIEKLVIKTPLKQQPVFQNEACFLYFKEAESTISSATEQIKIHTNESVLLKCGSYFADIISTSKTGTCEVFVIHLFPEILKELFNDEIPSFIKENHTNNYSQRIVNEHVIEHFIQSVSFYFENPTLMQPELMRLKLKELILLLLQTSAHSTIVDLFSHLFTPREATLTEVIASHLYSNLTLKELAKLTGQSLSTFKRAFEKHFSDTPANYIRHKRMQKAADLLLHSSLSISEVAYQVGFEDSSYFSRLFSNTYELSPSEYRQEKNNLPLNR